MSTLLLLTSEFARRIAQAGSPGSINVGGSSTDPGMTIESPLRDDITDISSLFDIAIAFLFPLGAVILFIMVVYAGFLFINSKGNAQAVTKAQQVIISAVIGFILLVLAFFMVRILATIFGFEGGILGT